MIRPVRSTVAALAVALLPAAAVPQPADTTPDPTEYLRVDHDGTGRFGITVVAGPESGKRLTFAAAGGTNNTAVSVGGVPFNLNAVAPTTPPAAKKEDDGRSWTAAWEIPAKKIAVTQEVVLARGSQSGKLDTAFVRYTLTNRAKVK
ncbi:MAG TPA: hypothetical protein VH092_29140, partial [Urbifossiella sp.]|nr:hypothetical protein [Urbifossiella sp.]